MPLTHTPHRPSWACRKCDQPWPCPDVKVELAEEYADDQQGLSMYLARRYVEASSDFRDRSLHGLYDFMLGWIRRHRYVS